MKKYPDGHFELVVVEVTAKDGVFNDAVKYSYQLLNTRWNTDIRYIFSIIEEIVDPHRQRHIIHLTLSNYSTHVRGIPDGRAAWMRDLPTEEVGGEISGKWGRMTESYNVDDLPLYL